MTTWMKKINNFQIAKVQAQGVAELLLCCLWKCCFWSKFVVKLSESRDNVSNYNEIYYEQKNFELSDLIMKLRYTYK